MSDIALHNVIKVYEGGTKAIKGISLYIPDGEFAVLIGPSGCGKSTLLRMIAGLEEITSGELYIGGKKANELAPRDRGVAMVFQNYALYPHKTVYENMAFGLKMAKLEKKEVERRVYEASDILGLREYLTRKPRALSGGQKQRVALGRAIVKEPGVFLFDEPLSNLDAKLRAEMRSQLSKLHDRLKTTFVYVTHDQSEAMSMAERIIVIKNGLVEQDDIPQEVYDHPSDTFVATFLGMPPMNLLEAEVKREKGKVLAEAAGQSLNLGSEKRLYHGFIGGKAKLGIRPDDVRFSQKGLRFAVEVVEQLGSEALCHGLLEDGSSCVVKSPYDPTLLPGSVRFVEIDPKRAHLFTEEGTRLLDVASHAYIPALLEDGKKLTYAKREHDLSEEDQARLLPEVRTGMVKALLVIPSSAFKLDEKGLRGKITYARVGRKGSLLFLDVEGLPSLLPAFVEEKELKVGETVGVSFDVATASLKNEEGTLSLFASHPFTSGHGKGEAKNGILRVGPLKLRVEGLGDGPHEVEIPYDAWTHITDKKAMKEAVVRLRPVNESDQGEFTLLYVNAEGFEDYLVLKGNKDDTCFAHKKMAFGLDLSKVQIS